MTTHNILLVDDDLMILELNKIFLEAAGYTIYYAQDGQQAIDFLEDGADNIDVIVSDINMPRINGYELCAIIKNNKERQDIPVVFVSALTDLDEKLKGYAVGVDDYINKPIQEEELLEKLKHLIKIRVTQQSLSQQAYQSQTMAMQALTFSSELGQVIEFYKNTINSQNYEQIVEFLFEIANAFGLISSIYIITPAKTLTYGSSGIVSPLEQNVIELSRKQSRFFDFSNRSIVNYPNFSLLVKNMPLHDEERYGRTKDLLAMICNGVDAKINQLNNDAMLKKKAKMMQDIQKSLNGIDQAFTIVQQKNINAIEAMSQDIHESLLSLGLTEYQEDNVMNIAEKCLNDSNQAFYDGLSIKKDIEKIQAQLSIILK